MRHLLLALAVAAATAGSATAQSTIVLPNGTASTEGSSSTAYPWGRGTAQIRVQYVYDSTNFTNQGITTPIVVTNLRFRANGGSAVAGYAYGAATVQMSTAAVDYLVPSTTFASNHGADLATVFTGPVAVTTPSGTTPNTWFVTLPITPFAYDPSSGSDLCLDMSHDGVGASGTAGPAHDSAGVGSLTSRIYNLTNYLSPTGTTQQNVAIVVDLGFSPAAGLFPAFSATPLSGPVGTTVQFTDQSFTSDPGGIVAWIWDLNGDTVPDSNAQHPSFLYPNGGVYDVTLTVVDALNGAQTLTKTSYVSIGAVDASFTAAVVVGTTMQFTDTSSGNPTSWAWDFQNDGIVDDTTQNPVFTYPNAGAYSCRLTVSNGFSTDATIVNVGVGIIPMPAFGSTFTSPTLTRGLWFQTPTRFSIVGLQVPDESGFGLQNVGVYRLAAAPPAFSASASGGLEFLALGAPSNQNVPCAVSFDAGEFVGVLGACGDATTMRSSYATPTGPYASSILGQPATLTRFITQTNLFTANGTGAYSTEPTGAMGRVQIAVSACVGLQYGTGSPSSAAPAPSLRTTALPFLGQTAVLTITNNDSNAIGLIAVGIGRLNLPTPLGTLLINNLAGTAVLNGGALMNPGQYTFPFAIPNDPSLQGFGPVNWQQASLLVPSGEFALSNATEWWLAL